MNTIAWILVLVSVLLGRAVYKGRVLNIGEDLSDAFLALISSDTEKLKDVLSRTGESNTAIGANLNIFQNSLDAIGGPAVGIAQGIDKGLGSIQNKANASVALAAIMLGERAKGYRWGATGPDYYDCSGLMWAAMKLAKVYNGKRFNTADFERFTKDVYKRVDTAQVEDIVLWPFKVPYSTGHIGVVTGTDRFYSARSVKSGIGETSISKFRSYQPIIFRRYSFPHPDGPQ